MYFSPRAKAHKFASLFESSAVAFDEVDEGLPALDCQSISFSIKVILLVPHTRQALTPVRFLARPNSDMMCFSECLPMRNAFLLVLATFSLLQPVWPQSVKTVLGSWEGESKCTVPDSPCHDEHVLYQIAQDKKDPWQLNLDGYKIVDGTPDFMGTLTCHYESKAGALSCTSSNPEKDDWQFHVLGDAMSGRLMIDDGKTLYRRITLHRVQK